MNTLFKSISAGALIIALSIVALPVSAGATDLSEGFQFPPAEAKPHVYWFWMSGNITRQGITADLEAMAEAGIGGALIFNVGESAGTEVPPGPIDYLSDPWLDLFKFAANEAKRLGITLGSNNCAGWSAMGGPWIKPEHGSQRFVSTVTKIDGGKRIVTKLAQPETLLNYYRDIAVIAYPSIQNEAYRVHQWKPKSAQQGSRQKRQPDLSPCPADAAIDPTRILDISKHLGEDGTLRWNAPNGSWTILRLGHTPMGSHNFPCAEAGRGLEVDKLNRTAVDAHWKGGVEPILQHLGPLAGEVFTTLHVDSYEAGMNQWTANMRREFKERRGYDLTPFFPALTGRLVQDGPTTDRFLWDYRRTVSELFAEHFYGHMANLCHQHGLKFSVEPYTGPFESLAVAPNADLPMGEFWVGGDHFPSIKLASSIAHINGRNLAAAEAYTAQPDVARWQNHPSTLKALGDRIWTEGINRLVLHAFVHQPFSPDIVPGMTFGQWGSHFDRNVTWLKPGKAWFEYLARSQFLLQHGDFAADVLCFSGEASPNGGVNGKDIKDAGYDYDACGTDIFAKLQVTDGNIVLPCGRTYRLLVMPDTPFQSPHIIRKVRDLVAAGATVLSSKPKFSPTLTGFPASESETVKIANQVWNNCDGKTATSNRYGKGRVFDGISPAQALAELKVPPAVKVPEGLAWIHRRTDDADLFFLSNQSGKPIQTMAGFRTTGRKPEFFDAEQGTITDAQDWTVEGPHTRVPLNLAPEKSVFIVFQTPARPPSQKRTASPCCASEKSDEVLKTDQPKAHTLTGPWNITFQKDRGAPETARFDQLISWSEHSDPGIRYFSGTATYRITFELPQGLLGENEKAWLDLGDVGVIAEARLNENKLGALWHKPFQIEVSQALRTGTNTLDVEVTNLWVNRLIGDEQHPSDCHYDNVDMGWYRNLALTEWPSWLNNIKKRPVKERVTFTTWKHWNKDDKLQPSGLLGPVRIIMTKDL